MKRIIFVCHGSICRSPAAAFMAMDYLKKLGREKDFVVSIRATSSEEIGNDVYPPMKRELFARGIPLHPHAAQRIRQIDYDNADYIFYMDEENRYSLNRQIDDYKHILLPINNWTPSIDEIEDPWYTGRYRLVCDEIEECLKDIFANI